MFLMYFYEKEVLMLNLEVNINSMELEFFKI